MGLHRAAQRTFDAASLRFQALLQAYADGVNRCIDTLPLPPEYALLELTQVRPWEAVDSVKIWKGITASFSLDIDTELTEDLLAYIAAGIAGDFDGQLFFSADVFRSAPMDPASTVPDATNDTPFAGRWNADAAHLASAAEAARRVQREDGKPSAVRAGAEPPRELRRQQRVGRHGLKSPWRPPDHRQRSAPCTQHPLHVLRVAPCRDG